jgi:hypothetical protein
MFLPIPTNGQRSDVVFSGYRWPVLDCCLGMWAPKPRRLVFDAINFPALWTCGQDDELVIDNQGFWFLRSYEELPEYRAPERLHPTKG